MASGNNFRYFRLLDDGGIVETDWESIPEAERQPRRLFHNVVGNAEISTTWMVADPDLSRQNNPLLFQTIVSRLGARDFNYYRDRFSTAKSIHNYHLMWARRDLRQLQRLGKSNAKN